MKNSTPLKSCLALMLFVIVQDTYTLDRNHARLGFSATHFGISHVEGTFTSFEATFKSSKEDFTDAVITMKADAKSIDTDNAMRDKDLRSDGWLDVEKYPNIGFTSTAFRKIDEHNYKLDGNLTLHGVTKPVSFNVVYNGKAQNPMMKKTMVGFTISGTLNRTDFGVGKDAFAGVVGKEIEIRSNAEFFVDSGSSK